MLIGCKDCLPASACDFKVLAAVIPPAATPDGTGSYCPGVYNCTGGTPVTTCTAILNIVNWLLGQWTNFQIDSDYPWNTYTTAFFTDALSTTPYSVTGPGVSTGYGGSSYGSNYTVGYPLVALNGASDGNICAYAQVVAMRMTGNLIVTPLDVPGETESCLWTPQSGVPCSASGGVHYGKYYIPLPPYDLCSEEYPDLSGGGGIQIAYLPFQTANNVDCLPAWTGGTDYTTCESPDPFFGDDPP